MAMTLHKMMPNEEAWDPTLYHSVSGSLMYLMTALWPDIKDAIGVPSLYNHEPSIRHIVALMRVFWYLNGTKDWQLHFGEALGERALGGEGEGAPGCYV
jgi:hypothetical protein